MALSFSVPKRWNHNDRQAMAQDQETSPLPSPYSCHTQNEDASWLSSRGCVEGQGSGDISLSFLTTLTIPLGLPLPLIPRGRQTSRGPERTELPLSHTCLLGTWSEKYVSKQSHSHTGILHSNLPSVTCDTPDWVSFAINLHFL